MTITETTGHARHKWLKQDSMGRNKVCDRCRIRVDRFGIGRSSYYVWSYSATRKGDTQNGSTVPPCPGYPPVDNTVVTIPTVSEVPGQPGTVTTGRPTHVEIHNPTTRDPFALIPGAYGDDWDQEITR